MSPRCVNRQLCANTFAVRVLTRDHMLDAVFTACSASQKWPKKRMNANCLFLVFFPLLVFFSTKMPLIRTVVPYPHKNVNFHTQLYWVWKFILVFGNRSLKATWISVYLPEKATKWTLSWDYFVNTQQLKSQVFFSRVSGDHLCWRQLFGSQGSHNNFIR